MHGAVFRPLVCADQLSLGGQIWLAFSGELGLGVLGYIGAIHCLFGFCADSA